MLTTIFILSGLGIAILLIAKRIEEKKKKDVFLLNLISRGDIHVRELHHGAVELYSVTKERAIFFATKQLPMRAKSTANKALARLEEALQRHFEGMRGSKLLKRSESISDFFKNIGEVEKGQGELVGEIYMEETEVEPVAIEEAPQTKMEEEEIAEAPEVSGGEAIEPVVKLVRFEVEGEKPKAKRVKKSPVGRRLKVVAQEEMEERF